jgi:hypothetical protein
MEKTPELAALNEKLKEDFPPEALSQDTSRGFALTSIKAAYIMERLNDAFGIFGWSYTFDPFETLGGEICIVVHLTVSMGEPSRTISQAGGKKPATKGGCPMTDARKSAVTDGLTKCASVLGVGHTIFKGQQDVNASQDTPTPQKAPDSGSQGGTGDAIAPPTTKGDITDGRIRMLHAKLKDAGIVDDYEKRAKVSELLGYSEPIGSLENLDNKFVTSLARAIDKLVAQEKGI